MERWTGVGLRKAPNAMPRSWNSPYGDGEPLKICKYKKDKVYYYFFERKVVLVGTIVSGWDGKPERSVAEDQSEEM